jgi:hypothetical protein
MPKNGSTAAKVPQASRMRKLDKKQAKTKAINNANAKPLISSFSLCLVSIKTICRFWKPLLGILAVYLVLNIIFASGLSGLSGSVNSIKQDFNGHSLGSGIGGLSLLIGTAGASGSGTGSALQAALLIIESLVIIWAIRHLLAGRFINIKQAYYKGPAPIIPFLLVLAVLIIQLLPITLGGSILAAILSSAFLNSSAANVLFVVLFLALAFWSIYMVSASIFGLYIVTLPGMEPIAALRSSKKLVEFRRSDVIRKVLFMPLFVGVVMGVIMVPIILVAVGIAAPIFYLLSVLSILFAHTYLYSLYRELL